jgi:hypothetical protein
MVAMVSHHIVCHCFHYDIKQRAEKGLVGSAMLGDSPGHMDSSEGASQTIELTDYQ